MLTGFVDEREEIQALTINIESVWFSPNQDGTVEVNQQIRQGWSRSRKLGTMTVDTESMVYIFVSEDNLGLNDEDIYHISLKFAGELDKRLMAK